MAKEHVMKPPKCKQDATLVAMPGEVSVEVRGRYGLCHQGLHVLRFQLEVLRGSLEAVDWC